MSLTAEDKQTIHDILYKCADRIPVQEITHAANEICKNPTQDKINEMLNYLFQFDKEYVSLQTVNVKAISCNDVRFAMSEIQKLIEAASATEEPDAGEEDEND